MKAIILSRVSTEEQKEAGNSIPAQSFRLEKYTKDKGLEVIREFEFDESAYKTERNEFSNVVKPVKEMKEPVALCCDKIDRLIRNFTRDLATLEELRREGKIELHFPSDNIILHKDSPATDLFRFTIGVSLAKYYSDSIRDNVKRAIEQKLRRGEWSGEAPIGYLNVELDGIKTITPDPERAPLIKKAFELFATDQYSLDMVIDIVCKDGLRTKAPYNKTLHRSHMHRILVNSFYYGVMVWKEKSYPHKYEPIIDRWLYEKCKEVRDSRMAKKVKYRTQPFIFRGMIRCAYCGCMITVDRKKNKYNYLACNQYKGKCGAIRIREEVVTKQVTELLRTLRMPQEVLEDVKAQLRSGFNNEQAYNQAAILRIRNEYDRVESRLKLIYEDRLDGRITTDEYDKLVLEYKQKQQKLNIELEDHTKADESFLIGSSYLLDLASRAADLFESPDDSSKVQLKRQLLGFLLSNLKLEGDKLLFNLKQPFDAIYQASLCNDWQPQGESNPSYHIESVVS